MSSDNKTSLGLNMWSSSDKPKRDDFNSDNQIIDDMFVSHAAQLQNKADITRGTYTPVLYGSTVPGSHGYGSRTGSWIRLNDLMFVRMQLYITTYDTKTSGNLRLSLPEGITGRYSAQPLTIGRASGLLFNGERHGELFGAEISANANYVGFFCKNDTTANAQASNAAAGMLTVSGCFTVSVT